MLSFSENSYAMPLEHLSPELALVDPELRERARAALEGPVTTHRASRPPTPTAPPAHAERPYPFWARVTAALWLLVLGILIGGAAIPHAQDTPRVIPKTEDATICRPPATEPQTPPDRGFGPGA